MNRKTSVLLVVAGLGLMIFAGDAAAQNVHQLNRYKFHISRADLSKKRGRYRLALRHLGLARRSVDRPAVLCDFGEVHLKLALKHRKKRRVALAHLRRAKVYFTQYLRRAPRGKLAGKARGGLRDVVRLTKLIR